MTFTQWMAEAKVRCEKATDGPWQKVAVKMVLEAGDPTRHHIQDAEFIAASRTDLPRALELLDEAVGIVKSLSAEAKGFISYANVHDHGLTNIRVMEFQIDKARTFLSGLDARVGE